MKKLYLIPIILTILGVAAWGVCKVIDVPAFAKMNPYIIGSSAPAPAGGSGHSKSDANLMGLWYFEDDLTDETANSNDLTAEGTLSYDSSSPDPATTNDGQTKSLHQDDDEVAQSNDTDLDPDTDFSAGGWFYPTAEDAYYTIISKDDRSGEFGWILTLRGDVANDPIRFYLSDTGTDWDTSFSTTCGGDCFSAAAWIHVVLVYDGTNEEVRLYVNGSEINADDFPGTHTTGVFNADTNFNVGACEGHSGLDFLGNCDEVFYFKGKALTDGEVSNIYTNGFSD